MRKKKKLGIIFYTFVTVYSICIIVFGILSIFLIFKYNFELYYFIPLAMDLFITFIFVFEIHYFRHQLLDVNYDTEKIRITLRSGRTHDISREHHIQYKNNAISIRIMKDNDKSLVIYKNRNYFNDSNRRLLGILDLHNEEISNNEIKIT